MTLKERIFLCPICKQDLDDHSDEDAEICADRWLKSFEA